jgi:hypothetical protein
VTRIDVRDDKIAAPDRRIVIPDREIVIPDRGMVLPDTGPADPDVVSVSRHGRASDLGTGRRETRRNEGRSGARGALRLYCWGNRNRSSGAWLADGSESSDDIE